MLIMKGEEMNNENNLVIDKKPDAMVHGIEFFDPDGNIDRRKYVCLLYIPSPDGDNDSCQWTVFAGRQTTYDKLKHYILDGYIDPFSSFILGETSTITDCISVYAFMAYMRDMKYIIDEEDFDIVSYFSGEEHEQIELLDITTPDIYIL